MTVQVLDLATYEPDDLAEEKDLLIFIVSTYEDGTPPESVQGFFTWLSDIATDFREEKGLLRNVVYAIFGRGHSSYGVNFNQAAQNLDTYFSMLHAKRLLGLALGDENPSGTKSGSIEGDFKAWKATLLPAIARASNTNNDAAEVDNEQEQEYDDDEEYSSDDGNGGFGSGEEEGLMDVEDLGRVTSKIRAAKEGKAEAGPPKDMITPSLRKALTKQGYRLLGTHSGVKLCRWTKSMLRGRGGCYKHTFYGIESHRCMETTPSLACANKCVFCWRHHTNPVGTEWRWTMDDPERIVDEAMANHYDMIKQFRGVWVCVCVCVCVYNCDKYVWTGTCKIGEL